MQRRSRVRIRAFGSLKQLAGLALLKCCLLAICSGEIHEFSIGVTPSGSPINAILDSRALDPESHEPRILLVAGLDGLPASTNLAAALMRQPGSSGTVLSVILNASPDSTASLEFPPKGVAYGNDSAATHYVWRFIGTLAPDLVVDLRMDEQPSSLQRTLSEGAKPADVGRIPAVTLRLNNQDTSSELLAAASRKLATLSQGLNISDARLELQGRLRRTPLEAAQQLELVYGHSLPNAVYIPALALIGRLALGDLENSSRLSEIEQITSPYLLDKPSLGSRPTGSHLSGHLVFAELFERTGISSYLDLARKAADFGFDPNSSARTAMPFHNEMSDAVFMGCAILTRVGRLTNEERYFRMALRHLRFMLDLDLRPDGLYRHSPQDPAAWGRGNGFPALGLSLVLSDWTASKDGQDEILRSFQNHMRALAQHQDVTGAWHQVIDRPESYREFSATAMIGFAITRGLRKGWLPRDEFESIADRSWKAVNTRIKADGGLIDVCRSTGKQSSLRAYYDREAILGHDDRGGAMALLIATERAHWLRER